MFFKVDISKPFEVLMLRVVYKSNVFDFPAILKELSELILS